MSKIKTHGKHQYSTNFFEEYVMRYKFDVTPLEGMDYNVDIYSTNDSKKEVEKLFKTNNAERVIGMDVIHTATRDQDDRASIAIDEWLNEDK